MALNNKSVELVGTPFDVEVAAGSQFTGTEFIFAPEQRLPLLFSQMTMKKGADPGMTWTLAIHRKVHNDDVVLISGATETSVVYTPESSIWLAPGDYMKLTTASATSGMRVTLWFRAPDTRRSL